MLFQDLQPCKVPSRESGYKRIQYGIPEKEVNLLDLFLIIKEYFGEN